MNRQFVSPQNPSVTRLGEPQFWWFKHRWKTMNLSFQMVIGSSKLEFTTSRDIRDLSLLCCCPLCRCPSPKSSGPSNHNHGVWHRRKVRKKSWNIPKKSTNSRGDPPTPRGGPLKEGKFLDFGPKIPHFFRRLRRALSQIHHFGAFPTHYFCILFS